MNSKKLKIGDKVRIIKTSMIEPYELNKIGIIIKVPYNGDSLYIVNMGRPRRKEEPNEFCWWLNESHIKLAYRKNQQLLFNFMYEE